MSMIGNFLLVSDIDLQRVFTKPALVHALIDSAYEQRRADFVDGCSSGSRDLAIAGQKAFKSAYVKDAGDLRIAPAFGKSVVPPKVLAALLGELSIVVKDEPGGKNPCEPQEPYQGVSLSVVTIDRTYDDKTETEGFKPRRTTLDIGGFWVINRTGEVERTRVCAE